MGKMKELAIELHGNYNSLNVRRKIYKNFFKTMTEQEINKKIGKARGNEKVAMVLALGDLDG